MTRPGDRDNRLPPDPLILVLARTLARADARRDRELEAKRLRHDETELALKAKKRRASKCEPEVRLRIPDGKGGWKYFEPDEEGHRRFVERLDRASEDLKAGRDDEFGISKMK